MKGIKKILFTLAIVATFFITTDVFAEVSGGRTLIIQYNTNGGNTIADTIVCEDDTCEDVSSALRTMQLPTPTRSGYTFKGWYTDEALTEGVVDYSTLPETLEPMPINGVKVWTYYAKWEQNSTDTSGIGSNDSSINTSGNGNNAGSTNTSEDEETGSIAVQSVAVYLSLVLDEDSKKEIKICDTDECENESALETKIKKIDLPTPEKDGYEFEGWYLDDEYTAKIKDTKELLEAIKKTKIKENGTTFTEDDSTPVSISISGSGNLEEQSQKISYKLYAKWTKIDKQVIKTGNTGLNQSSLFVIIGSVMVIAGAVILFKKSKTN